MSDKRFLGCAMRQLQCVNAVVERIQGDSVEGIVGGADVWDYLSARRSASLCRVPLLRLEQTEVKLIVWEARYGDPDSHGLDEMLDSSYRFSLDVEVCIFTQFYACFSRSLN